MTLSYGSVCSGIEAASIAWEPLGFTPVFFVEIEKFPSAALAHHYGSNMPGEDYSKNGTPNYGDMENFQEWPDHGQNCLQSIDILVGGTPCQTFSIAGLRAGLADPRGNLMLTFGAIAQRYRPNWFLWENVPGVLSSNAGRDFASFLGLLSGQKITPPEGGWKNSGIIPGYKNAYGIAYRVLDAQHCRTHGFPHAVPQRRRRVFVVGYIGDWHRAAAVLFDRTCLQGDLAPSRKTGKTTSASVAQCLKGSGCGTERVGDIRGQDTVVAEKDISGTVSSKWAKGSGGPAGDECQNLVGFHCAPVAPTVSQGPPFSRTGNERVECEAIVSHSLRGEGFDASEDGSGRGTPIIPIAFDCKGGEVQNQSDGATAPLRSMGHHSSHSNAGGHSAIAYAIDDGREIEKHQNGLGISDEGNSYTLNSSGDQPAVAYDMRGREGGSQLEGPHDTANIRAGDGGSSRSYVAETWAVRRLTPTECERLQGFPDGYTAIPWRNKTPENCPDGPRYKALGNSMAVNVMRVLGERIALANNVEVTQ